MKDKKLEVYLQQSLQQEVNQPASKPNVIKLSIKCK